MAKYLNRFTTVPKELFRLNKGSTLSLRDGAVKKKGSFDILSEAGKVKPKAITNPSDYERPNGASLRPNTPTQQNLVDRFKESSVVVYAIPKGTPLPENLVLVHEHGDHYSLQPAKEMTLDELNAAINAFLASKGKRMTKSEWKKEYPSPTESS